MKKNVWIVRCLTAIVFFTIWTACQKNHSSSDNSSSRTTLISQAVWKLDTAGADLNRDGIVDYPDTSLPACFKDNTYQFNKDSTGVTDNGAIKCSPSDPQTTPFTWAFSNAGDSVIQSDADPLLVSGVNIFSLSSTRMVLYKDTIVSGINIWFVLSLKH